MIGYLKYMEKGEDKEGSLSLASLEVLGFVVTRFRVSEDRIL